MKLNKRERVLKATLEFSVDLDVVVFFLFLVEGCFCSFPFSLSMSRLPPGFEFGREDDNYVEERRASSSSVDSEAMRRRMWQHRAWQLGKSPIQSVFYSLLMLYFAGSHLSLMSLMLTFMLLSGPIKGAGKKEVVGTLKPKATGLIEFRRAFEPFEEAIPGDATLRRAKVLYLTIYGAVFLVALWKTWQLGVFPITPADLVRFRSGLIASFVLF